MSNLHGTDQKQKKRKRVNRSNNDENINQTPQQNDQEQRVQTVQTESFLLDSSGNPIYTGITFDAKKLTSISNKKLKEITQNVPNGKLPKVANHQMATPITPSNQPTNKNPIILTQFQKRNGGSANAAIKSPILADKLFQTFTNGQDLPNTHESSARTSLYNRKSASFKAGRSKSPLSLLFGNNNSFGSGQTSVKRSATGVKETPLMANMGKTYSDGTTLKTNSTPKNACPSTIVSGQLSINKSFQAPIDTNVTYSIGQQAAFQTLPVSIENHVLDGGFVPLSQFIQENMEIDSVGGFNAEHQALANIPIDLDDPISAEQQRLHVDEKVSDSSQQDMQLIHSKDGPIEDTESINDPTYVPDSSAEDSESLQSQTESNGDDDESDPEQSNGDLPNDASSITPPELRNQQNGHEFNGDERDAEVNNRQQLQNNDVNQRNELLQRERAAHDHNCCPGCRNCILEVVQKMDELKLMLQPIVNNYRNENRNVVPTNDYSRLDFLPINDVALLKEFDQNLTRNDPVNEEMKAQFKNKIFDCGEKDMKKAVALTLPQILTNELGTKLVWVIKVEGKLAIQNYTFPSIIAKIFKDKYNCSEDDVKSRIKVWLQKSGDRIRIENKKMEKLRALGLE